MSGRGRPSLWSSHAHIYMQLRDCRVFFVAPRPPGGAARQQRAILTAVTTITLVGSPRTRDFSPESASDYGRCDFRNLRKLTQTRTAMRRAARSHAGSRGGPASDAGSARRLRGGDRLFSDSALALIRQIYLFRQRADGVTLSIAWTCSAMSAPGTFNCAAPLAARMRPRSLDEFAGQQHFLGPGKLLRRMLEADRLTSVIFYGPPGTGKQRWPS